MNDSDDGESIPSWAGSALSFPVYLFQEAFQAHSIPQSSVVFLHSYLAYQWNFLVLGISCLPLLIMFSWALVIFDQLLFKTWGLVLCGFHVVVQDSVGWQASCLQMTTGAPLRLPRWGANWAKDSPLTPSVKKEVEQLAKSWHLNPYCLRPNQCAVTLTLYEEALPWVSLRISNFSHTHLDRLPRVLHWETYSLRSWQRVSRVTWKHF